MRMTQEDTQSTSCGAPKAPTTPDLITVKMFAERCSISVRKAWTMVAAGKIKVVRLGKRCTRIPASEIDRLIQAGRL